MRPKTYSSFAEFEREEIRPEFKIGFSIDDLEDTAFDSETYADTDSDDFFDDSDEGGRF